jgi:alginate O-acetyltransferase complex protein AlgJ
MRNNSSLSGFFMIAFLAYAGLASAVAAIRGAGQLETPGYTTFARGEWARAYEKNFDESLPGAAEATGFWAALNYRLFGDGKSGVLVGGEGWLFTSEEFAWPADARAHISIRAAAVHDVQKALGAHGVKLIVALIPAKARVCEEHLGRYRYPSYAAPVYAAFRRALVNDGIVVPDILSAMKKQECGNLFLRTDTHWKPAGARIAAREIAAVTRLNFGTEFRIEPLAAVAHEGDLSRYVPGQGGPEEVETAQAVQAGAMQTKDALFGDKQVPVALVGTSYSANRLWNFAGFLKEALHADIINAAEEGLGPFETMERYLASAALRENPPQFVIWEIPERYLVVDAGRKTR